MATTEKETSYYVNEAAWEMIRRGTAEYGAALGIIDKVFKGHAKPENVGQLVMDRREQIKTKMSLSSEPASCAS